MKIPGNIILSKKEYNKNTLFSRIFYGES